MTLADWTGHAIGRYLVRSRLGVGGMGEVYRATDPHLKRDVALKRLLPREAQAEERVRRLLREGQMAAGLRHPAIVAVFDVFEHDGEAVLVAELIEGRPLRELFCSPFSVERFLFLAAACLDALETAHRAGVVHCDLKPENILVDSSGYPHILDFGFAVKVARDANSAPFDSTISLNPPRGGTPLYMSPEQLRGEAPSPQWDIFAIGLVFYEALTTWHPFRRGTFTASRASILEETPEPPSRWNPEVASWLDGKIVALLAKEGAQRPAARPDYFSRHDSGGRAARASVVADAGPVVVSSDANDFYEQARRYFEHSKTGPLLQVALRLLERTIELAPNHALAHAALAEVCWQLYVLTRDPAWTTRTEKAALRAAEIDSERAEVQTAMGTVHRGSGKAELAEAAYRRAIALNESHAPAHTGLGLALEEQGRLPEAEAALERGVATRHHSAIGHAALGRYYLRRGRNEEAVRALQAASDRAPDDDRILSDLGGALQMVGRFEEAAAAFENSIRVRPNYAALANLATLYRAQRRYLDAADLYERALALQDRDYRVWKSLAGTYKLLPERNAETKEALRRAVELAETAAETNPKEPHIQAHLGELYAELGDRSGAERRIGVALHTAPSDLEVILPAIGIYDALGDRKAAIACMERALELGCSARSLQSEPAFANVVSAPEGVRLLLRYSEPEDRTEG